MITDNTKDRILQLTNQGLDVFNYYLPDVKLPNSKPFKSPFYDDTKSSCGVYMSRWGKWCFKDLGDGGQDFGDCFWFVARLKGLDVRRDFIEVMSVIINDLSLPIPLSKPLDSQQDDCPKGVKPTLPSPVTKDIQPKATTPGSTSFSYEERALTQSEISYWGHYGITEDVLTKFHVKALVSYSSHRTSDGKDFTLYSSEKEPMFLYETGTAVKVYRPFSQIRFLQGGTKSDNTVFGLDVLPIRGDVVIITGGEKDVMSLSAKGFHAICFNSETSAISANMIDMLHRRFKHIILCYDMDETGIKASSKLSEQYREEGVLRMELPLAGTKQEKDISDYFASGRSRGDFSALITNTLEAKLYSQTMMLLKSCEIDTLNPPVSSESIVTIQDTVLGAYDNLFCVTGGEGTGKSNFVSALIAGAISQTQLAPETTLGIRVEANPGNRAVLHYDTEQSDSQLFKNLKRSLSRAALSDKPDNYHAICLTSFSRKERLQLIQESMDLYYHKHSGIHLVVIDGIADLIRSANDEIESVAIVEELYRLAGIYHTCIICVLHFVPNSTKLRGHIGSELQRKSAGILSVEKDPKNPYISMVKALKVRDGDALDIPIINIGWDKIINMPVFRGTRSTEEKEERKYNELKELALRIFEGRRTMPQKAFVDKLQEEIGAKDIRTSRKRYEYMLTHDIISCDEEQETVSIASDLR